MFITDKADIVLCLGQVERKIYRVKQPSSIYSQDPSTTKYGVPHIEIGDNSFQLHVERIEMGF